MSKMYGQAGMYGIIHQRKKLFKDRDEGKRRKDEEVSRCIYAGGAIR